MSEGLRISLLPEHVRELQQVLEAGLHELERFESVFRLEYDPVNGGDADALDRLWGRFWHAHGTIAGVADALESMHGDTLPQDLSVERNTT